MPPQHLGDGDSLALEFGGHVPVELSHVSVFVDEHHQEGDRLEQGPITRLSGCQLYPQHHAFGDRPQGGRRAQVTLQSDGIGQPGLGQRDQKETHPAVQIEREQQ